MFTTINVEISDNKHTLRIEVQHGIGYHYYIGSKGLRPEGIFLRRGASTVPASNDEIFKMIKEAVWDNYETARSLNQQYNRNLVP